MLHSLMLKAYTCAEHQTTGTGSVALLTAPPTLQVQRKVLYQQSVPQGFSCAIRVLLAASPGTWHQGGGVGLGQEGAVVIGLFTRAWSVH